MRHPQDDLLIVYALVERARDHRETPTEIHALELATEIVDRHRLTPCEVPRQLEERSGAHCWNKTD